MSPSRPAAYYPPKHLSAVRLPKHCSASGQPGVTRGAPSPLDCPSLPAALTEFDHQCSVDLRIADRLLLAGRCARRSTRPSLDSRLWRAPYNRESRTARRRRPRGGSSPKGLPSVSVFATYRVGYHVSTDPRRCRRTLRAEGSPLFSRPKREALHHCPPRSRIPPYHKPHEW